MSEIIWEEADAKNWDRDLGDLSGHPLQSQVWGSARSEIEGIDQIQLCGRLADNSIVALARVEIRRVPILGRVAWIPRGPAVAKKFDCSSMNSSLNLELKSRGFLLSAIQPWHELPNDDAGLRTIWIDLSVGEEQLLKNFDKQWRYGVRRAEREGVVVEQRSDPDSVNEFYELCSQISETKGFQLPGSKALIQQLLDTASNGHVETKLFAARHEGKFGAGVVVMRCGTNAHYLWGGVDRELSGYRTGEAVQWAVIQWAVKQGCKRYDLEGIDPISNPGTYKFKKKMGGREVALPNMATTSLRFPGFILKRILDRRS